MKSATIETSASGWRFAYHNPQPFTTGEPGIAGHPDVSSTNPAAALGLIALMALLAPALAQAELEKLDEGELSAVSGQRGISIEIPHLRINAHGSDSVDNPNTGADESDGRRTTGFRWDYVTREHNGAGEAHFFVDEVSLALSMKCPWPWISAVTLARQSLTFGNTVPSSIFIAAAMTTLAKLSLASGPSLPRPGHS